MSDSLHGFTLLTPPYVLAKLDANTTISLGNSGTALATFTASALTPRVQLIGLTAAAAAEAIAAFSTTAATGPQSVYARSKAATAGVYTAVASGDRLHLASHQGADGTDFAEAVQVLTEVDGAVAANQVPGRLRVLTATAAGALTEALRLNSSQQVLAADGTVSLPAFAFIADPDTGVHRSGANAIGVVCGGTHRVLINATSVVLGHTASIATSTSPSGPSLQTHATGASASANAQTRWAASSAGPNYAFCKSRGATIGTRGLVTSGDDCGLITFEGDDGVNFFPAAHIIGEVDGVAAVNDMPGRLVLATTAAGGTSATERMRINSSGQVAIGATAYVGSERVRITGGTIATAGATDVLIAAGAIGMGATTDSTSTTTGSLITAGGIGFGVTKSIFGGGFKSTSASLGIGYAVGAGGAVTQGAGSGKATGVTLNTAAGAITMDGAALNAATSVGFTLTNSVIAATDVVVVSIKSGATADSYNVTVDAVGAGSCRISLRNVSAGSLSEAVVLNFAVLKAVAS